MIRIDYNLGLKETNFKQVWAIFRQIVGLTERVSCAIYNDSLHANIT